MNAKKSLERRSAKGIRSCTRSSLFAGLFPFHPRDSLGGANGFDEDSPAAGPRLERKHRHAPSAAGGTVDQQFVCRARRRCGKAGQFEKRSCSAWCGSRRTGPWIIPIASSRWTSSISQRRGFEATDGGSNALAIVREVLRRARGRAADYLASRSVLSVRQPGEGATDQTRALQIIWATKSVIPAHHH